jgi:hypothetical protein
MIMDIKLGEIIIKQKGVINEDNIEHHFTIESDIITWDSKPIDIESAEKIIRSTKDWRVSWFNHLKSVTDEII